ncbi:Myc-type basic helix-loop-helix (bHLH) domain [Trinorchestia longiramus]|nr:Myc-type basic helix-loop-helix (bHLH) domain [Trinorchestia longiramus]
MRMYTKSGEKRRFDEMDGDDEEAIGTLCRMSGGHPTSPVCTMENEKRIRREIANSNERRRMQSINAGFASLKQLLPHTEGEKLSKAAILQQTADYIFSLEQEKKDLLHQNNQLKKILQQDSLDGSSSEGESPALNELISHIQDIQNNPTACKLPNTEFHKLNNNSTSKNNNSVDKGTTLVDRNRRLGNPVCGKVDGKNVLVSRQTAAIRLPKSARHIEPEDRKSGPIEETHYYVETPLQYVDVKTEQYPERRRRSNMEDSVKALVQCSGNKMKLDYGNEEDVKPEPCEYSSVAFGFEACDSVPRSTNAVVASTNGGAVLHNTNSARCYTINTGALHHPSSGHTGTTIVTILPPTPPHPTAMPSLPISLTTPLTTVSKVGSPALEVVSNQGKCVTQQRMLEDERCAVLKPRVEVEPASRIPTPDEIEYSAGESPPHQLHHQHEIHEGESYSGTGISKSGVNSGSNPSCQKSLDTICEAIRHLEGDHMFSATDDHCQLNRIEEEIITEETFPIHDSTPGSLHDETAFHGTNVSIAGTIVRHGKDTIYEICSSPTSAGQPTTIQHRIQFHPATTMVYGIDEHLNSSEPQEVPLELTTNNRFERLASPPPSTLSNQTNVFSSSSNLIQASRPGVIVVKQA